MRGRAESSAEGFTLTELLVAITILGIIMIVIGAMITTAFRTSTTVSAELQGSRGPKVVSRYWVPDVEQAETVTPGGSCGGGPNVPVVTMVSHVVTSAFESPADAGLGATRTITWCKVPTGQREQLVRHDVVGVAPVDTLVVVSDLVGPTTVTSTGSRSTITVTVPDHSRTNKEYTFDVTGMKQITTVTT